MNISNEFMEQHMVGVESTQGLDRTELRETRRLRNKQKKAAKKIQKREEREQKELILKLQVKSNNVTLITRDIADKVFGNPSAMGCFNQNTCVSNAVDFPALGAKCKANISKDDSLLVTAMEAVDVSDEKKRFSKVELADFLYSATTSKQVVKSITQTVENYNGNPLDSDMPIRKRGKFREIPKTKKRSKLKREILRDESETQSEKLQEHEKRSHTVSVVDTDLYDNIVTEELNNLITTFLSALVGLQEKLYKRDSIKGKSKRRYVVGLHEAKKHLSLHKVKILIMGPDIKAVKHDGALNCAIKEIIDLAKSSNVPHLFALKRRLLGMLTLKYIPVSCVAVLNYEGLEDQYANIIKLLPLLKKENQNHDQDINEGEANKILLNNLMDAFKCDD